MAYKYSLEELIKKINEFDGTSKSYILINMYMTEIMEHTSKNHINVNVLPNAINDKTWKSFYAAFVDYLCKNIYNISYPVWLKKQKWISSMKFKPIEWHKAHTDWDKTFLKYNILLPKGELQWI